MDEEGEAKCFLNGVALVSTDPVGKTGVMPMFYSWMTPKQTYYDLPLRQGANTLVILTQPNRANGRWGVGAAVLNRSGEILMLKGEGAS